MNIVKFRFTPDKPNGDEADSFAEAIVCCLMMYLYQYNVRPILDKRAARKCHAAAHTRRIHSEPAGMRQKRAAGRQTIYNHKRQLDRTIQWLREHGGGRRSPTSTLSSSTDSSSSNNNSTSSNTAPPGSKFSIQLKFSEETVYRNRF